MNIKVIVIFFALTGCIGCDFYKLTADENKDRASTCGKEVLGELIFYFEVEKEALHKFEHCFEVKYSKICRLVASVLRLPANLQRWRAGSKYLKK